MYFVTSHYQSKPFNTIEQAHDYIIEDMKRHNLTFKEVFNQTANGMQIIVFQYETLYFEPYFITQKISFL